MQTRRKRNSMQDEAEAPGASTDPMADAISSGSKKVDERAAHVAQSTEHGKETVTVSARVAMLLGLTDLFAIDSA